MTVDVDEAALAKAAQAVGVEMWRVPANPATIARAAVTAYLAARPTPDEAAMEREFDDALDVYATALLVNRGTGASDNEIEAYNAVIDLFRKAVQS